MMKSCVAVLAILAASATPALADTLPAPKGDVVLTVSGHITRTNGADASARFDLAMLDALPGRKGSMETPWTKGVTTFEGPLGRALLDQVGAKGTTLHVVALDDYAVDVPVADLVDHDVIFATRMDDKRMSVRDKGPLFLIYPFDKEKGLFNEKYFSRSVWQIKAITVN